MYREERRMKEYIISRDKLTNIMRLCIDLYGGTELIRCKDCANRYRYSQCIFFGDEEYCAWAERKEG